MAESHPDQKTKEFNMNDSTPMAARCKGLKNFDEGMYAPGRSPQHMRCVGGGDP
jgi:hypothetical protein